MRNLRIAGLTLFSLIVMFGGNVIGQEQHQTEKKKPTVMLIGSGEMKFMCSMEEHKIFSSESGKCPECGMKLKEMTDEDKKKMREIMKTHMAVNEKGEMIPMEEAEHEHMMKSEDEKHDQMMQEDHKHGTEMGDMKHDSDNKTILLIGDGEMKYTCSMPMHKVFSADPGKCPECGMNLKEMTKKDKTRLMELKKDHKVIKHIH